MTTVGQPKLAVWKLASCGWLPAHPAGLRGRAARPGRGGRDRPFHRGVQRRGRRALRCVPGRGFGDHPALMPAPHRRDPRGVKVPGAAPRRAGSRPCAISLISRNARPDQHRHPGHLHAGGHHVPVDFELRGCPIDRRQLLELLTALRPCKPQIPLHSVCYDCKLRGTSCVMVSRACLGPVTQAGGATPARFRPRLLRLLRPRSRALNLRRPPSSASSG